MVAPMECSCRPISGRHAVEIRAGGVDAAWCRERGAMVPRPWPGGRGRCVVARGAAWWPAIAAWWPAGVAWLVVGRGVVGYRRPARSFGAQGASGVRPPTLFVPLGRPIGRVERLDPLLKSHPRRQRAVRPTWESDRRWTDGGKPEKATSAWLGGRLAPHRGQPARVLRQRRRWRRGVPSDGGDGGGDESRVARKQVAMGRKAAISGA
jgi:hypothetical protein